MEHHSNKYGSTHSKDYQLLPRVLSFYGRAYNNDTIWSTIQQTVLLKIKYCIKMGLHREEINPASVRNKSQQLRRTK